MTSKYVALSDIHLLYNNPVCRLDNLVEVQWEKLTYAFEYARKLRANILVAGDIHVTSNSYSLLNQLISFLYRYKRLGVVTYAVYGQHDLKYRNPDDTNLQILINGGHIRLLEAKPELVFFEEENLHRIFGTSWKENIPEPEDHKITNILVIHESISPAKIYPGQQNTDAKKFLADNPDFDIVICGDIHRTFIEEYKGRTIINPGPLLRREADEYNLIHKPGFFYLDLDRRHIEFIQVPHKPASEVITRKHIEDKNRKHQTAARADTSRFLAELRDRTANRQKVNIRERVQDKVQNPDGSTSEPVLQVIEHLLNGKTIEQYMKENL